MISIYFDLPVDTRHIIGPKMDIFKIQKILLKVND